MTHDIAKEIEKDCWGEASDHERLVMNDSEYKVKINFGSVEPRTFHTFENGRMVTHSYSIHRDRNGNEISRTEPVLLGSIGYDDGRAFTEDDYKFITQGIPKKVKGFVARLFSVITVY